MRSYRWVVECRIWTVIFMENSPRLKVLHDCVIKPRQTALDIEEEL